MHVESDVQEKVEVQPPPMYKVVLYNDDFTPFSFVISILVEIFHFSEIDAAGLVGKIHESGKGIAGIFFKEIALEKKFRTDERSRENNHPLKCEVEQYGEW